MALPRRREGTCYLPIHDVVLVEVLERKDKLSDVEACALFAEAGLALEVPEELAAALEVGDEVEVGVGLEGELEADEEGALEGALEDLALADGVGDLLLRDDLALGEDLHGVDALGVLLADLEDAAERAAADELEELEVAWR